MARRLGDGQFALHSGGLVAGQRAVELIRPGLLDPERFLPGVVAGDGELELGAVDGDVVLDASGVPEDDGERLPGLEGQRGRVVAELLAHDGDLLPGRLRTPGGAGEDRKSTRLNSSHLVISYAVFCLKKKTRSKELTTR